MDCIDGYETSDFIVFWTCVGYLVMGIFSSIFEDDFDAFVTISSLFVDWDISFVWDVGISSSGFWLMSSVMGLVRL